MKICPICGSSYEDSVDFCFQDGAPLDLAEDSDPSKDDSSSAADSGPNLEEAYLSRSSTPLSLDDLDPPEAMSLTMPTVDNDDDQSPSLLTDEWRADSLKLPTASRTKPDALPVGLEDSTETVREDPPPTPVSVSDSADLPEVTDLPEAPDSADLPEAASLPGAPEAVEMPEPGGLFDGEVPAAAAEEVPGDEAAASEPPEADIQFAEPVESPLPPDEAPDIPFADEVPDIPFIGVGVDASEDPDPESVAVPVAAEVEAIDEGPAEGSEALASISDLKSVREASPDAETRASAWDAYDGDPASDRGPFIRNLLIAAVAIVLLVGGWMVLGSGGDARPPEPDSSASASSSPQEEPPAPEPPAPEPEDGAAAQDPDDDSALPDPLVEGSEGDSAAEGDESPPGEAGDGQVAGVDGGEELEEAEEETLVEEEVPELRAEPTPSPTRSRTDREISEMKSRQADPERRRADAEMKSRQADRERRRADEKRRQAKDKKKEEAKPAAVGSPWRMGGDSPPSSAPSVASTTTTSSRAAPAAASSSAAAANPWGSAPAQNGRLAISSQPAGAIVYVDGARRGTSPVLVGLSYGDHEIRLEKSGFATQTRILKVVGTKTIGLDVVLESLRRVAQGTLNVVTAAPAVLSIDGVRKGTTPISVNIASGTHTFRLEVAGKPAHVETVEIKVEDGGSLTRFFPLPP